MQEIEITISAQAFFDSDKMPLEQAEENLKVFIQDCLNYGFTETVESQFSVFEVKITVK